MDVIARLSAAEVHLGSFRLGPIDLEVHPGEVIALCGHNGSGKTTLIRMLTGTRQVARGSVEVMGTPVRPSDRSHLSVVGYVPDEVDAYFPELTAVENVELVARLRDRGAPEVVERGLEILSRLGLGDEHRPARAFSHGMKKKLMVVLALMHRPSLLVVDELRNGLDPLAAVEVEDLLDECRQQGVAVIASTHDMTWMMENATRLVVLSKGSIGFNGVPRELGSTAREVTLAVAGKGLL